MNDHYHAIGSWVLLKPTSSLALGIYAGYYVNIPVLIDEGYKVYRNNDITQRNHTYAYKCHFDLCFPPFETELI